MEDVVPSKNKLNFKLYMMCGWPFFLVFIGGAIGGGLAGIAYVINLNIYKSNLSNMGKIILNILVGCLAIVLWIVIRGYIHSKFL